MVGSTSPPPLSNTAHSKFGGNKAQDSGIASFSLASTEQKEKYPTFLEQLFALQVRRSDLTDLLANWGGFSCPRGSGRRVLLWSFRLLIFLLSLAA